jgi:hypothetical protein
MLALAAMAATELAAAEPAAPIDMRPVVAPNDLAQVTLELEAGGTMRVRQDSGRSAETQELPMSAAAKLRYDEHRFAPASGSRASRSVRYYDQAEAVLKVEPGGKTPRLSDPRRLVVAQLPPADEQADRPGTALRLFLASPRGLLSRDELDLLDVTSDSLVVDLLLPERPVSDGDTWSNDASAMAALLALDSVAHAEVRSVLDKHNDEFALAKLAGSVVGIADGAATEIELRGVFLFDRKLRRITRLNLAVKEIRSIGGATPGLDGVAKLRMNVKPIESSEHLSADVIAALRAPEKQPSRMLELVAAEQGYRVIHDRGWFVTSTERERTTLRRVVGNDLVAQCTITKLPAKSEGRQTTLEEFERDIRFSLGKNFGQLVASRQWTNAFKHRCLEVVVRGTAEEVPVEWHYYLVFPENGHRVSVVATIDGQMVQHLAAADRRLVNAIQLVPIEGRVAEAGGGVSR